MRLNSSRMLLFNGVWKNYVRKYRRHFPKRPSTYTSHDDPVWYIELIQLFKQETVVVLD